MISQFDGQASWHSVGKCARTIPPTEPAAGFRYWWMAAGRCPTTGGMPQVRQPSPCVAWRLRPFACSGCQQPIRLQEGHLRCQPRDTDL